jgi:dCMP deaminase
VAARAGQEERLRPTWDEYFLSIARVIAGRSTCLRREVGALVVKDKRILTTGYNGAPRGLAHCLDVGCLRNEAGAGSGTAHELCRGLHAEQNAIIQAALHGVSIEGGVMYSTHQPCVLCTKMIINAGLPAIYYLEPYPDPLARKLLQEAGVVSVKMSLEG